MTTETFGRCTRSKASPESICSFGEANEEDTIFVLSGGEGLSRGRPNAFELRAEALCTFRRGQPNYTVFQPLKRPKATRVHINDVCNEYLESFGTSCLMLDLPPSLA
ncbi:unnamed protein product [Protopolystoma xenopodis]|uniref:Uncharacterized protein n=1 Tax=Protopolystoma xenopodis TaxID=117903 RepID=A0A3S5CHS4_9PLAT|nr:unnamed protein product [Protopolystoma xenopodis]